MVAVVILSACSVQEVSGAQLRSGADLNDQPDEFVPLKTRGQSKEEYEAYAEKEKSFGLSREDQMVSQNAVYQAKGLRKMENAVIKGQLLDAKQVQGQLRKKETESEAFKNLDEDEKDEREIEKADDEETAKIKDESAKKNSIIKEDVEFNRMHKEEDKKEEKVKSKTEVKVVKAEVVKSEQKLFHSDPDAHDEPETAEKFDTMIRGDDKELSDMFFEDGKDDKAKEDSSEAYVPGLQ